MTATWSGTPKTWSTGELVTASNLNAELRDRMEYLKLRLVEGQYICIRDEKASGTNGGTFTSGAWQTRDLNTEVSDVGGYASVASNQITLGAGTYLANIRCPAYQVSRHKARLQNITDGTTVLLGTSEVTAAVSVTTESKVCGIFTLAASKVLEVQHYCSGTLASTGFGLPASFGVNEVYTTVELIRIGD